VNGDSHSVESTAASMSSAAGLVPCEVVINRSEVTNGDFMSDNQHQQQPVTGNSPSKVTIQPATAEKRRPNCRALYVSTVSELIYKVPKPWGTWYWLLGG